MTERRQQRIELAAYDGEPAPRATPVWVRGPRRVTGAQASMQRLWFNPCLHPTEPSRMFTRSTALTEMEAIEWAERGLVRLKDVSSGTRIQSHISFRHQFGTSLDHTLILAVREGVPEAWQAALRDGSALARHETRRIIASRIVRANALTLCNAAATQDYVAARPTGRPMAGA